MFWFMVFPLSLWRRSCRNMKICLRYLFPTSFTSGKGLAHYASCTINHAKIKIFGDYYIVIPICINYFKNHTKTCSFVHPEPHSYPTPSTFQPLFVDDKFFGAGLTVAVVDNCLCISELPNALAANGEQGEYGSD